MTYDSIVIGSGIGGLTAAGLLAQVANQRVLVLEKHTEPGGLTHTFRRDGATWNTGLHYVGQVSPGASFRRYFDLLSGGQLDWLRLPEPYDRFIYPGLTFDVPSNREDYIARLSALFPDEAPAIRRWFRDAERASRWVALSYAQAMVPRPIAPLVKGIQRLTGKLATSSTRSYLDTHFRSERLKALLASQCGDYGLPPSESAFAAHAIIVTHYLDGAWFPKEGSSRIARTIEKGIEERGGAVRVAQEAVEVIVENGRAVGVKAIDRRGARPVTREFRAPVIISDVGAERTLTQLLPTDGPIGEATAPLRSHIARLGRSCSAVTVYLRLREHPQAMGQEGGNLWIFTGWDHDEAASSSQETLNGTPRGAYVSFPAAKAREDHHTVEITEFSRSKAFSRWAGQPPRNRGASYDAIKQQIAEGLISLVETNIPGLRDLITHVEVSTPLTIEHYTSHPDGACYGLPCTPERIAHGPIGPRMPLPGLFLTGQDVVGSGIAGALMGGVAATSQVLGPRGFLRIQKRLREQARPFTPRLPEGKHEARVARTRQLTPSVWEVLLDVPEAGAFTPGQFARLEVAEATWRDYSIVSIRNSQVRFLISTRTGGPGSRFVASATPGTPVVVELPLGQFSCPESTRRRVFVATGTGLAPFLAMMDPARDELIFGCRFAAEDLSSQLNDALPPATLCITGEDAEGARRGRVTDALADLDFDPGNTEFYLCGSTSMVTDASRLLARRGARFVFSEPY